PLYVPGTVPGDRVLVRPGERRGEGRAASLLAIVAAGSDRADPPCAYFGTCGGCALQHLADDAYAAWKVARLRESLDRCGFGNVALDPLVRTPPGSRRRAGLKAVRAGGRSAVGFAMRESHVVVDLVACAVMTPALAVLLGPLHTLADRLMPRA